MRSADHVHLDTEDSRHTYASAYNGQPNPGQDVPDGSQRPPVTSPMMTSGCWFE